MNDTTVEPGGAIPDPEWKNSPWARRVVLIVFCLALLTTLGAMFTRVIAARVPEQRATLEKLITERTGLSVRFDNVHFAWGVKGTSAVFERVELTDPARDRLRVVAPELRVEFDAWDFLRHQQFSLGHVKLSSPDIDIIGDAEPEEIAGTGGAASGAAPASATPAREEDEAAWVRRFTAWAELMPPGRVEVEGARVHLFRRGERKARHDFTLSQAVVSRGAASFNAFGTMLLSQDVGQSLFVSANLERVGAASGVDGELRLIARRVLLGKLPAPASRTFAAATRGRGTVDATIKLHAGRITEGHWQVSARDLDLPRDTHFDHFTVKGTLSRAADDFLFELNDLQLTRGARLERAPRLTARLSLVPGTMRVARISIAAERLPFMAGEFMAGVLAPPESPALVFPADWSATAGELHEVRFDSGAGTFAAQVKGGEIMRGADRARVGQLSARVEIEPRQARVMFTAGNDAHLHLPGAAEPRNLEFSGTLVMRDGGQSPELDFAALRVDSGDGWLLADGAWTDDAGRKPLALDVAQVDRALIADLWTLLTLDEKFPRLAPQLADVQQGRIVSGRLSLVPAVEAGQRTVDWLRSRGTLQLDELASAGEGVPTLAAAAGSIEFARGGTQLRLVSGRIEDLEITQARVEWPRRGTPRLVASLQGDLNSPFLRRALAEQGLERLSGVVALDAEARGEQELRDARSWRVTARLRDASLPLSPDLPPVESLTGTVRFAGGQLRGLALRGSWLGGKVAVESRRAGALGVTSASIEGESDAASLLKLLGQPEAGQVKGQMTWSGSLQRRDATVRGDVGTDNGWTVSLNSNLAGVESRLPEPFDKTRARHVQVSAELRFDTRGVEEFSVRSGRDEIRGRVEDGVTLTRFDVQGVAGELRAAHDHPRLNLEKLELRRVAAVLAAAGALLPAATELTIDVAQLRHANRGLGALAATLTRDRQGVEFSLQSVTGSPHELHANGVCANAAGCRMEFTLDTSQLRDLLAGTELPVEWPTRMLRAAGKVAWRGEADGDIMRSLTGNFELETQGANADHQLMASATIAEGQIDLSEVHGSGPEPDQVFRGNGRVRLQARTYDVTVDYERLTLAASAMPTPARARLARAWSTLRGSAAKHGWTDATPARRVQWRGSWDNEP